MKNFINKTVFIDEEIVDFESLRKTPVYFKHNTVYIMHQCLPFELEGKVNRDLLLNMVEYFSPVGSVLQYMSYRWFKIQDSTGFHAWVLEDTLSTKGIPLSLSSVVEGEVCTYVLGSKDVVISVVKESNDSFKLKIGKYNGN